MGGNRISVLSKEHLPYSLFAYRIFQVENGTIFYLEFSHDTVSRLYVKWHGREINAELPVKELKSTDFVEHGNKLFFAAQNNVYSVAFNPPNGIIIVTVRNRREGEEFREGGICSVMRDGIKYFSRICDDPGADGIIVESDSTFVNVIHRGRAVYCDRNNEKGEPSNSEVPFVRAWNDSMIVIELPRHRFNPVCNALDSYPFIYVALNFAVAYILNNDTMEFLPELRMSGYSIQRVAGIHGGVLALLTWGDANMMGIRTKHVLHVQIPEIMQAAQMICEFESEFLQKFAPQKVLGKGTFGIVFEARNKLDKWSYAVKRIAVKGRLVQQYEIDVENTLKEVCVHAALKHEGLVGYNSAWIEKPPAGWQKQSDVRLLKKLEYEEPLKYKDDCWFIYVQMELCTQTLHDWLISNATRDLVQAKLWTKQLVSGVGYLHQEEKIHRDLKPLNILFDSKERLKICDLGLITDKVLQNGQEIDRTRTSIGTPMYMAPEQRLWNYTSKVDIFSLGLIFIELCVHMNSERKSEVLMDYQRGKPCDILKEIPEADQFVSWLTNIDPTKRPTCDEILACEFFS